jgi:tripartite-type tricarboxylate transporter receptor subunit TctC
VPTLAEAGVADADYPLWYGLFLPAKTRRDIVNRLHGETLKALHAPNVENKLATLGIDPMVMTPAAFDAQVKAEIGINARLVKAARINVN